MSFNIPDLLPIWSYPIGRNLIQLLFLGMQQISTGLKYVEVARLFAESQKMKHLFLHPYLKAGQLGFPYDDGPLLPSIFNVIASPPQKNGKVGQLEIMGEHGGTIMNFTSWNNSSIFWGSTIYIDYVCDMSMCCHPIHFWPWRLGAHHCRSLQILSRGSHSGWTRQTLTEYSYSTRMWGPPVISWFISPSNYSYKYHKP